MIDPKRPNGCIAHGGPDCICNLSPNIADEFFDWPEEENLSVPAKTRWRLFRSLKQRNERA